MLITVSVLHGCVKLERLHWMSKVKEDRKLFSVVGAAMSTGDNMIDSCHDTFMMQIFFGLSQKYGIFKVLLQRQVSQNLLNTHSVPLFPAV